MIKLQESPVKGWDRLSIFWSRKYVGWHSKGQMTTTEDGRHQWVQVYKFWLEPFSKKIKLSPENLSFGILHYAFMTEEMKKNIDKVMSDEGEILIPNFDKMLTDIPTVSLYSEHVPEISLAVDVADLTAMTFEESKTLNNYRQQVRGKIDRLPKYLSLLDQAIREKISPLKAAELSGGVITDHIL